MLFFSVIVKIQMVRVPMKHTFFIRSYDDKHLGCFLFLAVGDSAITNINLQMALWLLTCPVHIPNNPQSGPQHTSSLVGVCFRGDSRSD